MKDQDLLLLWTEVKDFLSTYTNAQIDKPSFIKLKIYPSFDRKKLDANLQEIISVSNRETLEPIWNISNENLEKAITGLHNVQQHLNAKRNDIELEIWYNFRFLDTIKKIELPNYECDAHIEFIFSKRHNCSPCLIFPFIDATLEFWKYLDEIKPKLPFQLDENLLRKMNVKNGLLTSLRKVIRPT
jgi:hypothetical protein